MPEPARPAPLEAVVFDLDDTLYDALGQCVVPAQREAAQAMCRAGLRAPLEAVLALREAWAGSGHDVDREVAAAFPCLDLERVVAAGRRAFLERDPGALSAHAFTLTVLERVRAHATCVLLSAGHAPTQRTKVERLGLASAFDEQIYVDPARGETKESALRELLKRRGLPAANVLVVGDRPDGEIAAALKLGCRALRIRAGEFAPRSTPTGVPEAADVRAVLDYL